MQNKSNEDQIRYYAGLSPKQLSGQMNGLSEKKAEKQRIRYGSNRIREVQKDTIWTHLRRAFITPFSVVLMALAVISFISDVAFVPETGRNYTTVLIISSMLFLSGCVRLTQEMKSKKRTDQLVGLVDYPVHVRRDGTWTQKEAWELAVGDLVRLSAGQRVPADIRITKARDCFLSESGITGESEIQEKTADALTKEPERIRDYKNIAFCGTTVVNGFLEGLVAAVGDHTLYGEIAPKTAARKQGYDQGANSIAWVLIRFMALLVPVVFIASGLTKGNWIAAFFFALSVAVGLTPELLPMVITACLAKGSFRMSQKQTIVKNVNAMQGFGSMDVLCVDKTGTLTGDTLLLEYYMDILGNENQQVLDFAYLNSVYHSGIRNPLDTAILKVNQMPNRLAYYADVIRKYEKLDEIPFDYTRKIASVLLKNGQSNLLIAKGGVDDVLRCCRYAAYQGRQIEIGADGRANVHAIVDEMLQDGMKVLAVAAKTIAKDTFSAEDEQELTLLGYLAFFDAPKKTAASAIQKLNDLHVATKVLTGDHADTAASICRRLGIDVSRSMTGRELDRLSDNDAQVKIEETLVFAELSPAQKTQIVEILQSNGHTVGFLADGMNDLPAVLQADVGISVDTAVPSVKECADVILLKKDLNVLESGIQEGRRAFANMSKYVKITASSNLGNIIAIVFASIFLPFFPMTSVQILLLNLLYDLLCLVLPWDHVDREMVRRPLEWSGKTLSRFMLTFGPISSLFDIVTYVFLYYFLCPAMCGGGYEGLHPAAQAQFISMFQTGWFLESMWTQILIWHLLRTRHLPFLQSRPSMPVLTVTCLGIGTFTLMAVTPVGRLIGMTGLPPVYFVFLIVTVCCYLLVVTWVKQLYMKRFYSLI